MAKFIPFETDDNRTVSINPDWVMAVIKSSPTRTVLSLGKEVGNKDHVMVLGSYDAVLAKLVVV